MFDSIKKLCLLAALFALLTPALVRAAEDDEDEGPLDPKLKAARERRLQKEKLTAEAPKDPALPRDANNPIDLKSMTQKEALVKEETPGKDPDGAIDPKKFAENAKPDLALGAAGKGVCQTCQGQRIIPILPYTPFIKIHDSDPANNPEVVPTYKPCPTCNAKFDVKEFLADIKEHQEKASAKNKDLENLIGVKLLQAENQYVSVRTSLTSKELRKIMAVIERLSAHLGSVFQSMTLLTSRPDDGSIIYMTEAKKFDALMHKIIPDPNYREFAIKMRGTHFEGNHIRCLDPMDIRHESHAVFNAAQILIRTATNGNAPSWLTEGFADYCEWSVLNKNQHYSVGFMQEYSAKDQPDQTVKGLTESNNWVGDIRKVARANKVSPYNSLMHFDMIGMKKVEYLSCMGVVCCLVKTSPRRFDQMIQFIRDGEDPAVAMEKAYGRKIAEMEKFWTQWMSQPQW